MQKRSSIKSIRLPAYAGYTREPALICRDGLMYVTDSTDTFDFFFTQRFLAPYKKLIIAILTESCRGFFLSPVNRKNRILIQQAKDWFKSDNLTYIFSFRNVCEDLGIDPDCFRQDLREYAEGHISQEECYVSIKRRFRNKSVH